MNPWNDPNDPSNSAEHHTGKPCVDCPNPAGTAWSPYWCWQCNAKRIDRIDASMRKIAEAYGIDYDELGSADTDGHHDEDDREEGRGDDDGRAPVGVRHHGRDREADEREQHEDRDRGQTDREESHAARLPRRRRGAK